MVNRGLLDTSVLIALEQDRAVDRSLLPNECAVSIITLGELRLGILAAQDSDQRTQRLETMVEVLAFDALPVDKAVIANWASLKVRLRDAGLRMESNDALIAATAIAHQVPLVTQDRDFLVVPGLEVILV